MGMYFRQESILYVPQPNKSVPRSNAYNPEDMRSPADWNLPFEDVRIKCKDGVVIHGWFIKQRYDMDERYTFLYFHGNASNIGSRLPFYSELYKRLEINIFCVDYRGYGDSSGKPNEKGLNLDAQAALDYLYTRVDIDTNKIIVFGRSLGGAVSIALTHSDLEKNRQPPVAGLIIENTFTCIAEVAVNVLFPLRWLHPKIVAPLLYSKWISKDKIGALDLPILFISGLKDEIIPCKHMAELYRLATQQDPTKKQKKQRIRVMKIFEEGKHNDTPLKGGIMYYATIRDFIEQIESKRRKEYLGELDS